MDTTLLPPAVDDGWTVRVDVTRDLPTLLELEVYTDRKNPRAARAGCHGRVSAVLALGRARV